ncbi:MAG TPA: RNA methyltransferase, partial [Firmicutes bacterium]|nr:RNA methyltransferase [Bacillota bacterium]
MNEVKTLVPYSKLIRALNNDRKMRKKEGLFVLEGPKLLEEALDAGLNFRVILVGQSLNDQGLLEKAKKRAPLFVIEDKEVQSLSSTVTPQGVIAVLEVPQYTLDDIEKEPFFLVLDGIQDPGNLGTLFRTALASGAGGLILIKNTVDPFNPKVVRSAMGALFKLPFVTDISIDELT